MCCHPRADAPKLVSPAPPSRSLGPAAAATAQDGPRRERVLYRDGHEGRLLLDGPWLFRLDPATPASARACRPRPRPRAGARSACRTTTTPRTSPTRASAAPSAGTARTSGPARRALGLPLRVGQLPRAGVPERPRDRPAHRRRHAVRVYAPRLIRGVNRLVVRVDNRRVPSDFPAVRDLGPNRRPSGGWWNYGGLLREVYLRAVVRASTSSVHVDPRLPCRACPATVRTRVRVRNADAVARVVSVDRGDRAAPARSSDGARPRARPAGRSTARTEVRVPAPVGAGRPPALRRAPARDRSGRRGRGLRPRDRDPVGASVSPDGRAAAQRPADQLPRRGAARGRPPTAGPRWWNEDRERHRRRGAQELGANLLRTHYPLHPGFQELADRRGLLVWSEIPMFRMKHARGGRGARAPRSPCCGRTSSPTATTRPCCCGRSATSSSRRRPTSVERGYVSAAARAARALDPSRPVAWGIEGVRTEACRAVWASVDVLGVSRLLRLVPHEARPAFGSRGRTSTACAPATRARRSSSRSSAPRPTATGPRGEGDVRVPARLHALPLGADRRDVRTWPGRPTGR